MNKAKPHTPVMASNNKIILPPHVIKALAKDAPEVEAGDPRGSGFTTPHLSYSQIATYLRCSMQYKFKYLLKAPDKPKVSLAIGKGGHNALEKNIKRKIVSKQDSPVDEVVQWASDFMDHELAALPPSEIEKDVEPGETKDKFLAATRVFQTRDAPKIKPIGAEVEFTLDMNEFQPEPADEPIRPVVGKIDLLSDDTETHVVHSTELVRVNTTDYKFVTRKRGQAEVNISPQLSLYAAVVQKLTGKWPTKLGYVQLHPGNKTAGPDAIPLLREPEHMTPEVLQSRLRRLAYQFRKVEEGIRKDHFVPTDDPITCSWCPVRDRCQMTLVDDFEAAKIREQTTPTG